ncbi:MAG: long-chain fatty acid--CoA ligase [Gammaproteobacteria bacterium RIFCSPLOWO2_02_FULL_57_10]|nr:MAG: long-chain fatty acid--CoA ligase [Gammaproteobacteria bacterium RIFCSPLOWO2_02_FULL_57_10]
MSVTQTEFFPALRLDNHHIALQEGEHTWRYSSVHQRIDQFASGLLGNSKDLEEERIAFFMPASLDYVTTLLGVWRAGGIAVPLNIAAAIPELEHALSCAGVTRLVVSGDVDDPSLVLLNALCKSLNVQVISVSSLLALQILPMPVLTPERRAMILFTSGTTNKPKGVVSTHKNIRAQITTLLKAWEWQEEDSIPLFLPLHHIHGIINVLCCGLWMGARVSLFAKFDMETILEEVIQDHYTVFMAVPTIYVKIIQHLETLDADKREAICNGFRKMRLNISGSAACPVKLYQQWQQLTGQTLLERYGMTEIGMGISNPYNGERRAGAVGIPLPGVDAALFDDAGNVIDAEDTPGEIRIRGNNVFLEYWNNPKATEESFKDGWFCTGDVAIRESGYFRIMGRSSVDIIKSGGYKLSALEIEGTLLTHEKISECAVIGVEDDTWGEAVTAFVVLKPGQLLSYGELKSWCESRMSPYKIPKTLRVMESLPRNAMGKVMKPELKKL